MLVLEDSQIVVLANYETFDLSDSNFIFNPSPLISGSASSRWADASINAKLIMVASVCIGVFLFTFAVIRFSGFVGVKARRKREFRSKSIMIANQRWANLQKLGGYKLLDAPPPIEKDYQLNLLNSKQPEPGSYRIYDPKAIVPTLLTQSSSKVVHVALTTFPHRSTTNYKESRISVYFTQGADADYPDPPSRIWTSSADSSRADSFSGLNGRITPPIFCNPVETEFYMNPFVPPFVGDDILHESDNLFDDGSEILSDILSSSSEKNEKTRSEDENDDSNEDERDSADFLDSSSWRINSSDSLFFTIEDHDASDDEDENSPSPILLDSHPTVRTTEHVVWYDQLSEEKDEFEEDYESDHENNSHDSSSSSSSNADPGYDDDDISENEIDLV